MDLQDHDMIVEQYQDPQHYNGSLHAQNPVSIRSSASVFMWSKFHIISSVIFIPLIPDSRQDLKSPGSPGNLARAESKISRISWQNEYVVCKILHDPGSWILRILNSGSFWDLDTCLPTVWACIMLHYCSMSSVHGRSHHII